VGNKSIKSLALIAAFFLTAFLAACNKNNQPENKNPAFLALTLYNVPFIPGPAIDYSNREGQQRGRLLTAQPRWNLPRSYMENFVTYYLSYIDKTLADYPTLTPRGGVIYYYITYETVDVNGAIVEASGAVWVPRSENPLPLLAFCHGTMTDTNVSLIRLLPGLFAGRGFLSVGPDYLGYGASENIDHPYLHAATLASSTIDSIRAAKKLAGFLGITLNGKLFVSGISEGGMAAMATIRELELNYPVEHPLTAGAPISGPYDMRGSVDYYVKPDMTLTAGQRSYMAFMIPVYRDIYPSLQPLDHYIQEPYATWFTLDRFPRPDAEEIINNLPSSTNDLLVPDFVAAYQGAGETEFKDAIDENSTYRFVPECPLRMYAANQDTSVPPENADTALDYFTTNGAPDVAVVNIDGDHGSSGLPFTVMMLDWFSTF
jgi:pimeloyl-ACP methyl ester carboxylesterase